MLVPPRNRPPRNRHCVLPPPFMPSVGCTGTQPLPRDSIRRNFCVRREDDRERLRGEALCCPCRHLLWVCLEAKGACSIDTYDPVAQFRAINVKREKALCPPFGYIASI